MEKTNIRLMCWYIRFGRFIYAALFAAALIITLVQIAAGRQGVFRIILLDAVMALIGAVLELTYFSYRERGTIYVETGKREKRIALAEYNVKNQSYYVDESLDDYSVKASGKGYSKSYKKREVDIEEDAGIDRPFLKIEIIEKTSKPADNDYSVFASTGDKIETEVPKIVVRNKAEDIRRNQ